MWGFRLFPGVWCCVTGWVVPDVLNTLQCDRVTSKKTSLLQIMILREMLYVCQTASVLLSWKFVNLHFSTVCYINLKSTFLKWLQRQVIDTMCDDTSLLAVPQHWLCYILIFNMHFSDKAHQLQINELACQRDTFHCTVTAVSLVALV